MSKQKVFKIEKKAILFAAKVNGILKDFSKGDKNRFVVRYKSTADTKIHAKQKNLLNMEKEYIPPIEYNN